MSSEAAGNIDDENKVKENDPVQNEDEQQNDVDSTNSKPDETNEGDSANVIEQDHQQNETADPVQTPGDDASLDVSTKSEGRMGLRRAKTKGVLKKQLELKKEKLRNPLLEANDSDSIPSPHSATEQKQMETSMVKVPKEIPETIIKWTEGDMFWGHVTGHPWWPCMVFKDPHQGLFTKMIRANLRTYHFHFFGSSCERAWVVESSTMVYEGQEKFEEIRKEKMAQLSGLRARSKTEKTLKASLMSFDIKSNRMSTWKAAVEEAEKAFEMDREARMKFVGDILTSKKKSVRRESGEGTKRKREEQGDEPSKKKPRKSEGVSKLKTSEANESKVEAADETMETNVDESLLEGNQSTVELTNDSGSTQTPSVTQGSKTSNHIEATPERAVSTRYKLRAVRKLKKLTDDEDEEEGGDSKANRKSSVASATGEESDASEDSTDAVCLATKPKGGEAVRTQEVFKLSHNNSNNYKKEEVCIRCESSHPGVVKCKGPCHAPLHPTCVGVKLEKTVEGEDTKEVEFICDECRDGQHTCFICKNKDSTTVKCGVTTCCFYYHVDCIKKLKYVKFEKNQPICPMHVCISCAADSEKTHLSNRGRFFKCIRCPNSYHTGDFCIAAGSVVLSNTWIICGDHHVSESKKKHQDHLNAAFCFSCGQGGSLVCCESCPASYHNECCEEKPPAEGKWNCELCTDGKRPMYGEIVWCKGGVYRWWPGEVCHPRNVPTNIQNLNHGIGEFPVYFFGSNDYLWSHRGRVFSFQEGDKGTKQGHSKHLVEIFNKALEEADDAARVYYEERNKKEQKFLDKKPTPYRHVKSNVPIGNVEIYKVPLSEVPRCQCSATMDNPCGPESDCINRLMMYECDGTVCLGGERCMNRTIQMRNDADTEVFRTTDNRGWGLRAKSTVPKGRFVHEYVGDLIDELECRARLKKAREQNISNFYMLTLDKNRIIDAGPKGNNSRFMNHSCQPNCETQKWTVNGDVRVALFALTEVKAGEELTFNYNLECLGDKKTVCNCGTPVCSGFLGERPKSSPSDNKNTKPPKKQRKKQKSLSKLVPLHEDICYRCGNPGELVLCNKVNCTKSYHLKCLKLNQLPKGKWICPWHLCGEENCGKWAVKLCSMCPNSFCSKHSEGNISVLSTGRIVCDEHPPTCPQLQYLLAQDEVELDRKKESQEEQEEKKMNGDAKMHDIASESPFPLVSTPFPKKGRGRPPKHPKLGESPILGSASKAKSAKAMKKNPKLSASQLVSTEIEASPDHNHVSTQDTSLPVERPSRVDESDVEAVNGQNEESKDRSEEVKDKLQDRSHDEVQTDARSPPHSAVIPNETATEVKNEFSEVEQTPSESLSPRKSNDDECCSPPKKRRRTSAEDEEGSESNHSEKLSNGFAEPSNGPSPRPSIHQAKEQGGEN